MTRRDGGSVWVAMPSRHCASQVDPLCTTTIASTRPVGRGPVEGGADTGAAGLTPAPTGVVRSGASSSGTAVTFTRTPAGTRVGAPRSDRALLQLAALSFGQPTPDPEPLVVGKCVLEALSSYLAPHADLLGLAGGAALLGEERLRIGLGAERTLLPGELALPATRIRHDQQQLVHDPSSTLTSTCVSTCCIRRHRSLRSGCVRFVPAYVPRHHGDRPRRIQQ